MRKLALYAGILGMMAYGSSGKKSQYEEIKEKESEDKNRRKAKKAEVERNKANGLKEFFYGENSLWALNQKTADKKAKKLDWL